MDGGVVRAGESYRAAGIPRHLFALQAIEQRVAGPGGATRSVAGSLRLALAGVLSVAGPVDVDSRGRAAVLRDPQGAPFSLVGAKSK